MYKIYEYTKVCEFTYSIQNMWASVKNQALPSVWNLKPRNIISRTKQVFVRSQNFVYNADLKVIQIEKYLVALKLIKIQNVKTSERQVVLDFSCSQLSKNIRNFALSWLSA